MNITSTWLTINRNCNLLCKWCYAQDYIMSKNEMSLELAKKLIDISKEVGSKSIFLIGGEPTIHPNFFEILEYVLKINLKAIVVTNGIKINNRSFCEKILRMDFSKIQFGISLKGSTEEEYKNNCGKFGLYDVIQGIKNCEKYKFNYSLSYVLTENNVIDLENFASNIKTHGIEKNISFIICNDTLDHEGNINKNSNHPLIIDKVFSEKYDNINHIMNGKISIHQTLPLCQCNQELLQKILDKNQITTSCHVHRRNGLIFDTDGSLLLCNNLPGFKFGEYNIDFCDGKTLREYFDSDYAVNMHKKFTTMPSSKCIDCDKSSLCGGGCCIQWFSNDFDSYIKFNTSIKQ